MSGDTNELLLRAQIVRACLEMTQAGVNQGTSGNISVRFGEGMLITPSGMAYDRMTPDDIVFMDFEGKWTAREGNIPSSEWRFHLDILRAKPEVGAVVHAHPTYCTILAIMHMPIPAIHYMIAAAGGNDIPCAPYRQYGTQALSDAAVETLRARRACLLAHHGLIATGPHLARALWLAIEVETLARQYHGCLQLGAPPLLCDAEIDSLLRRWGGYGLRERSAAEASTG